MRPWECSQTDRHTHTDANRFYNLSHAICYSYGTDNKLRCLFDVYGLSYYGYDLCIFKLSPVPSIPCITGLHDWLVLNTWHLFTFNTGLTGGQNIAGTVSGHFCLIALALWSKLGVRNMILGWNRVKVRVRDSRLELGIDIDLGWELQTVGTRSLIFRVPAVGTVSTIY